MTDHVSEIKAKIDIVDLVGSYTQLKKAGRNFKALCPFHQEKTPSFTVNPERQFCWCFGCNHGGDIFQFIQAIENVDFSTALRILAQKAGITIENSSTGVNKETKNRLRFLHEKIADFYQEKLKENSEAQKYLIERGISPATLADFRFGWAPNSFEETVDFLKKENFTDAEIVESGIGAKKDLADIKIYDRFRGRIMIPITDSSGAVIAFGGRIIGEGEPKYLNSPETPLYHKSQILFGFDRAKEAIKKLNYVIVVEGYMDVIASHQAKIENVVASSGTALTEEQLKLISRYTKNILLSFDADAAGAAAAYRGIELAQKMDFNIRVVQILTGKDPDECIRKDVKLWEKAIDEAVPIFDFVITNALKKNSPKDILGKKALAAEVLPFIANFASAIEREENLKKLSDVLEVSAGALEKEMLSATRVKKFSLQNAKKEKKITSQFSREDYLLGIFLVYPENLEKFSKNIFPEDFMDINNSSLYKKLQTKYNEQAFSNLEDFLINLGEKERSYANRLMFLTEEKYPEAELAGQDCKKIVALLKNLASKKKREVLSMRLVEAKQKGEEEEIKKIIGEYMESLK